MYNFFHYLFMASMIATTIYGCFHYKYIKGAYRWILYQLIVTSLGESYAFYSLRALKTVANPMYHVLNPIEFALFAVFFYELTDKKFTKKLIVSTTLGLIAFSIVNVIWLQPLTVENTNAYLAGSALMVVYSLMYYYELYQRDDFSTSIVQIPSFWIVSGVFFLYLGSFFVIGLVNLVSKNNNELASLLYVINLFLNILLYAFTFYGLRWAIQNKKPISY
jgi:hypothetical protein